MLKIIHVLNHFLPYQTAGTEVYVWALSKELQKSDFDITVLIPNYGSQQNDTYLYDGLTVVKYAEPSLPDRALITGQKLPEGLVNFKKYLEEQQPAIVHFHEIAGSNGIGIAHIETAKAIGAKVVLTLHLAGNTCSTGTLMYKGKELCDGIIHELKCARCVLVKRTGSDLTTSLLLFPSRLLYNIGINSIAWQNSIGTALSVPFQIKNLRKKLERIVTACDKIVPITEWYHKILLQNGVPGNKMQTIFQALPVENKNNPLPVSGAGLPLRFIFIGRIDALKGIPLLIETVRDFTANQIQLDIYGGTADSVFLDKCKNATSSYSHIRWMGKLQQEEVVATICKYDALILPSAFSEMSPLVIQEAFAAGVPVIGSNVYGIAEQVQHGINGWLFQFENKVALQNLLLQLIQDPARIARVKNNLSIVKPNLFEMLTLSYKNLYEDITNK